MKKIFTILFLLSLSAATKAQIDCGSVFDPTMVQNTDAARYNRYLQLEQFTANYISALQI